MKTCTYEHCRSTNKTHYARGLCECCYKRLRDRGTLEYAPRGQTCTLEGCDKKRVAKGYCKPHWRAWRQYGDPLLKKPYGRTGCEYPLCPNPHRAMGLCTKHYAIRTWLLSIPDEKPKRVPVQLVLPTLEKLRKQMPMVEIARRAQLQPRVLYRIYNAEQKTVNPSTLERLEEVAA